MIDVHRVRAAILEHRAVLGGPTVVYLNPQDLAGLSPRDRQLLTSGGGIVLEPDQTVAPGGYSVGKGA